jgi:hypothetical protein
MWGRVSVFRVLGIVFVLLLVGCKHPVPEGHYQGNLSVLSDSKLMSKPVSLEVSYHWKSGIVEVKDFKGVPITVLVIDAAMSKHPLLTVPLVQSEPFQLKKVKGGCYFAESQFIAEVCFEKSNFILNIRDQHGASIFMLSGTTFKKEKLFTTEPVEHITLSEAVDRTLSKNFESRLEYQKLKQAKYVAVGTFLNLFPRFSVGGVIWNLGAEPFELPITLISSIGELAPFLLPNRWLNAFASAALCDAEKVTQILMQANIANQVEGLAYIYERERKLYEFYVGVIERFSQWLEKNEEALSKKNLKELKLRRQSMELLAADAADALRMSRGAVALSIGAHDPDSIGSIDLGKERISIKKAVKENMQLDGVELGTSAVSRSFELRQIDYLTRAARITKIGNWFNALDPGGDSNLNWGPALFPLQRAECTKIKSLLIQREQTQTALFHQGKEVSAIYNKAIYSYPRVLAIRKNAEKKWNRFFDAPVKKSVEVEDLQSIIEEYISSTVAVEEVVASFRIARSKADRLRLDGLYFRLYPKLGDHFGDVETLASAASN